MVFYLSFLGILPFLYYSAVSARASTRSKTGRPAQKGTYWPIEGQRFCEFSSVLCVVCDMKSMAKLAMSRQRETPRGAPRSVPSSSSGKETPFWSLSLQNGASFLRGGIPPLPRKLQVTLASFSSMDYITSDTECRPEGAGRARRSQTRGGGCGVIDVAGRHLERRESRRLSLRLRHPDPARSSLATVLGGRSCPSRSLPAPLNTSAASPARRATSPPRRVPRAPPESRTRAQPASVCRRRQASLAPPRQHTPLGVSAVSRASPVAIDCRHLARSLLAPPADESNGRAAEWVCSQR